MSNVGDKSPKLSRAEKDVLAANYAYSATRENGKDLPDGVVNLGDIEKLQENGIKFLGMSDFILDEKDNLAKMRSVIFLDERTKEITVAIAGTRPDQGAERALADLRDDARLAAGFMPRKLKAVEAINEKLIEDLKSQGIENIGDYKFNFTGHSLGAVMADCAAADMTLRLQHKHKIDVHKGQISTVTFDNPGALTAVQGICKQYKKEHPDAEVDLDELKKVTSFKAINNRPNFINTMDSQVGERFTIVPKDQKPLSSFRLMCGYVAEKCRRIPVIGSVMNLVSMGRLDKQVADHSLANFQNVIVNAGGILQSKSKKEMSLDQVITGLEPIKYNAKVFNELHAIRNSGNEGQVPGKYSMLNPETQERVEFSLNQAARAMDKISRDQPLQQDFKWHNGSSTNVADTRKFTDMFKSKKAHHEPFHIKTIEEVVSHLQSEQKATISQAHKDNVTAERAVVDSAKNQETISQAHKDNVTAKQVVVEKGTQTTKDVPKADIGGVGHKPKPPKTIKEYRAREVAKREAAAARQGDTAQRG